MNKNTKSLVISGLIAAIYIVLTMPFSSFAFGPIQFRLAEVLCLLPFFSGNAIAGVFIGCLISNIVSGFGALDIVFGSLTTLLAAYLTYKSKKAWLCPIYPVLLNGLIIGGVITFSQTGSIINSVMIFNVLSVGASELVVCYFIGLPFLYLIRSKGLNQYLN